MNRLTTLLVGIAAACTLAACSHPSAAPAATLEGAALASSQEMLWAGTLCSGPVECEAAPLYSHVILAREVATAQLKKGAIDVDQAVGVQRQADQVRTLLDAALKSCNPNSKNGKCQGDEAQAVTLLKQATASAVGL